MSPSSDPSLISKSFCVCDADYLIGLGSLTGTGLLEKLSFASKYSSG
jgi:hypothetical protein